MAPNVQSLPASVVGPVFDRLRIATQSFGRDYPGELADRQPVHTVYGGAHLFKADSPARLGQVALAILRENAPDADEFARAVGLGERGGHAAQPQDLTRAIYDRVVSKLKREPVEDFRIDFEDGYGPRPDNEEDSCAESAANEVAKGLAAGTLPPFIGIRIKPLLGETAARGARTLDLFLSAMLRATGKRLPPNFVVTNPKVVVVEQVSALADLFDAMERQHALAGGSLKMELMIETTQSIFDREGRSHIPALIRAARGRCTGAHFGVYDYTATCSITAEHQRMGHPACDFARHMMQVALAGTGIRMSDGATNIMPVGPHRAGKGGPPLTAQQQAVNRAVVHRAWRLHFQDVRHSLENAFYQGWDLNPGQLPTRYAAVISFFLEGLDAAASRLRNFVEKAALATLAGDVFDDAATGQGLLNFFLRGVNCGAITEAEAQRSGLTLAEIRMRSFAKILAGRGRP